MKKKKIIWKWSKNPGWNKYVILKIKKGDYNIMMGKVEKICKGENRFYKKYLKKRSSRIMRSNGKKYLDEAPKKHRFYGYSL